MSPKPVDIDHAVELLKADGSTAEMKLRARKRLDHPTRNALPKLGVVGIVALVVVFAAWPKATAGRSWAQAVQASSQAKITHSVTIDPEGHKIFEDWRDGQKIVVLSLKSDGQVTGEVRSNGDRLFGFHSNFFRSKGWGRNPNSWQFGMIINDDFAKTKALSNNEGRLDRYISHSGFEIVGQKATKTFRGPSTSYELKMKRGPAEQMLVVVDEKSGLIVETSEANGKYRSTFDYPQSVDPSIFEPRPQTVKNCQVCDNQTITDEVQKTIANGLGKSKGITLRLVALDSSGTLLSIWTGSSATSRTDRPMIVPNMRLGKTWPIPKGSSWQGGDTYETTSDGSHVYGLCQEALTKIGERIDISVPIKGGKYAKFKSVRVLRIAFFEPSMIRPKLKSKK